MSKRMPAYFIAHGSPQNVLWENDYTRVLNNIKDTIEKPKAILVISAHWKTRGAYVNVSEKPKQIYDFYGFDDELYAVKYEPKGSPEIAKNIVNNLKAFKVKETEEWGLDHGAWGVLKHMYPEAEIPVFQLSINGLESNRYHYELGKKLSSLRDEGVLIIGSGNIAHNLMKLNWNTDADPFSWAVDFENSIKSALVNNKHEDIINYEKFGQSAKLSVPTDEHFIPLIYLVAMQQEDEKAKFIYEGFQNATMSMTCVKFA